MDKDTVVRDIEHWITTFVEVPHPALGGWPPCPYARSARLKNSYEIVLGLDPYRDLTTRAQQGLGSREVWIYVYDAQQWPLPLFSQSLQQANRQHLVPCDMLALEDHPADVEMVNGVCMNQGTYALALVQSLSDLDAKAQVMANKGFYQSWPNAYLTQLFQHRKDPRS